MNSRLLSPYVNDRMPFGQIVEKILEEYDWSANRLSKHTGISPSTIRSWFKRSSGYAYSTSPQNILKIAIALELDFSTTDQLLRASSHPAFRVLQTQAVSKNAQSDESKEIHELIESLINSKEKTQPAKLFKTDQQVEVTSDNPHIAISPEPIIRQRNFIGRQQELERLEQLWNDLVPGRPSLVKVTGVSGMGKTFLCREFCKRIESQGAIFIATACTLNQFPYTNLQNFLSDITGGIELKSYLSDPLYLEELAQIDSTLAPEYESLRHLNRQITAQDRDRLYEALSHAIVARKRSLLIFIDDIQWINATTLEWMEWFCGIFLRTNRKSVQHLRIMFLVSLRDGFENHMERNVREKFKDIAKSMEHFFPFRSDVAVRGFTESEIRKFVKNKRGEDVGDEIINLLHQKFSYPLALDRLLVELKGEELSIENLAKFDANDAPRIFKRLVEESVYPKLSEAAQDLATIAAVIGYEFEYVLLWDLSSKLSKEELWSAIDELIDNLVIEKLAGNTYHFLHSQYRDALYLRIKDVEERCRDFHQKVAESMERIYVNNLERMSPFIGEQLNQALNRLHFKTKVADSEEKFLCNEAIKYFHMAAQERGRQYALSEQILFLEKALDLIQLYQEAANPEDGNLVELITTELAVTIQLTEPYIALKGYNSEELIVYCQHAENLCRKIGLGTTFVQYLTVLSVRSTYHLMLSEYKKIEECTQLTLEPPDEPGFYDNEGRSYDQIWQAYKVEAEFILAVANFHAGRYNSAFSKFLTYIHDYDNDINHLDSLTQTPHHALINGYGYYGVFRWHQGYPEEALQIVEKTVRDSEGFGPYVQAVARFTRAWVWHLRGDWSEEILQNLKDAIKLCEHHKLHFWGSIVKMYTGCSICRLSRKGRDQNLYDEGYSLFKEGYHTYVSTGAIMSRSPWLCYEVQVYLDHPQGLYDVEFLQKKLYEAQEFSDIYADSAYDAEINRLNGILAQLSQKNQEAENYFIEAIRTANNQGVIALRLRAATSLAEFRINQYYCDQLRLEDSRYILKDIYDQYSEGHDTIDIKKAKSCLGQLDELLGYSNTID